MNHKWAWCMPHQCGNLRCVGMVRLGTPTNFRPQLWEWHVLVSGHSFSLGSGMRIHMLLGQAQTCPAEPQQTHSPHETWAQMSVWAPEMSRWFVTLAKTDQYTRIHCKLTEAHTLKLRTLCFWKTLYVILIIIRAWETLSQIIYTPSFLPATCP